ncbi:hypothetical protein PTKU64_21870 [Paraburkholderia terrae]|uniref:Single-stranded DNA-binding protein n=1 Tax=Paraburkholderia terrae TaxID=311230 RepID=A0ABM7THV8_9BURK|nr:hypothetical protein [Paraburkholderia terrae]BCZ78512.1 hypothetical protein PTKU64_21870 [Paraburkholderia terrae]
MNKITTPKGIAGNLFLARPDTKFGTKGFYKVGITLNAAEVGQMVEACNEEATRAFGPKNVAKVKMPFEVNAHGTVTFKFGSRSRPNLYDSTATLLEPGVIDALRIGYGSTIRVKGETATYERFGGGVLLLMHEVQIIDLVESGGFAPDVGGSFVAEG